MNPLTCLCRIGALLCQLNPMLPDRDKFPMASNIWPFLRLAGILNETLDIFILILSMTHLNFGGNFLEKKCLMFRKIWYKQNSVSSSKVSYVVIGLLKVIDQLKCNFVFFAGFTARFGIPLVVTLWYSSTRCQQ